MELLLALRASRGRLEERLVARSILGSAASTKTSSHTQQPPEEVVEGGHTAALPSLFIAGRSSFLDSPVAQTLAALAPAAMPPGLVDDLLVEILLRLPPDDPACLLRASAVCKRWRRILADPAFRLRHRALYPAPSVVGFLEIVRDRVPFSSRFVVPGQPASGRPVGRDLPGWLAVDCRHGRALFVTPAPGQDTEENEDIDLDFIVWDPLTDEHCRLPPPSPPLNFGNVYNASVLCAAASGSCDHRGCHRGPFHVALVVSTFTAYNRFVVSASTYSSETGVWSGLTSVQHTDSFILPHPCASALVGDTLYFHGHDNVFEYQLGLQHLSMIDRLPPNLPWMYMVSVDDKLAYFNVEKKRSLSICLWSQVIDSNGVAQWARNRVIKLEALLPKEAFLPPPPNRPRGEKCISVIGFAEGTHVIFLGVPTHGFDCDVYMVDLNSRRAKKIIEGLSKVYPYTSFCIPVIDSGSTGDGPEKGISSV